MIKIKTIPKHSTIPIEATDITAAINFSLFSYYVLIIQVLQFKAFL